MPRRSNPDPEHMKLGGRIRALREERGMSMSRLAERAALSKGHMSSIEAGYHAVGTRTITTLALALGVAPMYLLVDPAVDERQHAAELLRRLPIAEVKSFRRQLQARIAMAGQ